MGGYGRGNQAMSFGTPLVAAGLPEDKADVNARVAWAGVGLDLAPNKPTPHALRDAVRAVLDKPNYRARASLMAEEFAGIDSRAELLRIVGQVSQSPGEGGWRRPLVAEKLPTMRALSRARAQITSRRSTERRHRHRN